jgi:hypothetical protein
MAETLTHSEEWKMDNIEVDADALTRAFRDALAQAIRDVMREGQDA